jgi:hypothetical protein
MKVCLFFDWHFQQKKNMLGVKVGAWKTLEEDYILTIGASAKLV